MFLLLGEAPIQIWLLPGNIERCQWVNRYYRIKVLLNAVGQCPMLYSAKTQRMGESLFLLRKNLHKQWSFFYLRVEKTRKVPAKVRRIPKIWFLSFIEFKKGDEMGWTQILERSALNN